MNRGGVWRQHSISPLDAPQLAVGLFTMKTKISILTLIIFFTTILVAAGVGYGSARAVSAMVDETVAIPDPVLQAAIRDNLNIHGRDIRASDLAGLKIIQIRCEGQLVGQPGSNIALISKN
jgi:hypothetical protein